VPGTIQTLYWFIHNPIQFQNMVVQHSTRYWPWSCDQEAWVIVNWLLQELSWQTGTDHQYGCTCDRSCSDTSWSV